MNMPLSVRLMTSPSRICLNELAIFNLVFIHRFHPFLFQSMSGFVLSTSPVTVLDPVMVIRAFQGA
jgi:hypothetical protein